VIGQAPAALANDGVQSVMAPTAHTRSRAARHTHARHTYSAGR
jgi:hypothetical protein